ncbi:MAG: translation initiation factor IF-3 [Thermosipho sp. (in: Bacteria)]|nr:translation initiation factor IF-3 [Thermosipho sp. (in: thermotogales)]
MDKIIKNEEIRASEVRVVDQEGKQLGIMPTKDALELAYSKKLDLILVAPNANPPVAKIMDYGKYKYELAKREKKAKKNQKIIEVKQMKFRIKIDEHDYQTKVRHIKRFLEQGNKVRVVIMFRGRELAFVDKGKEILERVISDLKDIATVEKPPKLEGRDMWMMLKPKN